MKATSIKLLS